MKFAQDILDDEYHVKGYQKFSDDNNLGLNFRDDESHRAGLSIAELGHFNYKTEDDIGVLAFYLPSKVTGRQLEYFESHIVDFGLVMGQRLALMFLEEWMLLFILMRYMDLRR